MSEEQGPQSDQGVFAVKKGPSPVEADAARMGLSTVAMDYEGGVSVPEELPPRPRLFGWKEGLIGLSVILTLIVGSVILIILSLQVRLYNDNKYSMAPMPQTAYTLILPPGSSLNGQPPPPGRRGPYGRPPPPFAYPPPPYGKDIDVLRADVIGGEMAVPVVPLDDLWSLPREMVPMVQNIVIRDLKGEDKTFTVLNRRSEANQTILTLSDGYRLIAAKKKATLQKRSTGQGSGQWKTVKTIWFDKTVPTQVDVHTEGAPARRLGADQGFGDEGEVAISGLPELARSSASLRALGKEDEKAYKGLSRGLGRGKKGRGEATPPPEIIRTAEPGGPPTSFMDAYCRYGCGGMAVTFPYYYRPFFGYGYPLVGTQQSFPGGYGGYAGAPLLAAQAGNVGMGGQTLPISTGGGAYPVGGMQPAPAPNPYAQQPVYTGPGVGAPVAP